MTRKTRQGIGISALVTVAMVMAIFASIGLAKDTAPPDLDQAPIAMVGDPTKNTISVFRQTNAVTPPAEILDMFQPDPKTGETFFGFNALLARPAYPIPGQRLPVVWMIPGPGDSVFTITSTRKGVLDGGTFGPVADPIFLRQGSLSFSISHPTGGKRARRGTLLTIVLPDSITSASVITRDAQGMKRETSHAAHDNVIVVRVKRLYAVRVNGHLTKIAHRKRHKS